MGELGTIDSETSKDKSAKPSNEMKIVVVAPSKTEYKESQAQRPTDEENKEVRQITSDKSKIAE
jgi:cellobiose-specific phosphotransferase system component IIB